MYVDKYLFRGSIECVDVAALTLTPSGASIFSSDDVFNWCGFHFQIIKTSNGMVIYFNRFGSACSWVGNWSIVGHRHFMFLYDCPNFLINSTAFKFLGFNNVTFEKLINKEMIRIYMCKQMIGCIFSQNISFTYQFSEEVCYRYRFRWASVGSVYRCVWCCCPMEC